MGSMKRLSRRNTNSRSRVLIAVHRGVGTNPLMSGLSGYHSTVEILMKFARTILATAAIGAILGSGALAQQAVTGSVAQVDEAHGKITIQPTQSGTVGAAANAGEDYAVQDGLMFNALQPGDKVVVTVTDVGGVKTITKIEKQ
jgi:Cu/Ag efflux protein CusF